LQRLSQSPFEGLRLYFAIGFHNASTSQKEEEDCAGEISIQLKVVYL